MFDGWVFNGVMPAHQGGFLYLVSGVVFGLMGVWAQDAGWFALSGYHLAKSYWFMTNKEGGQ